MLPRRCAVKVTRKYTLHSEEIEPSLLKLNDKRTSFLSSSPGKKCSTSQSKRRVAIQP